VSKHDIHVPSLRDDLLWGAQAIADELGRPRADIYHLLLKGVLPANKVGVTWVTTKSRLRAFIERDRSKSTDIAA
jgi:hypothetical protein